jgi:hypothetical protein
MSSPTVALCLLALPPLTAAPLPKEREKPAPFLMTREGDTKVSETRGNGSIYESTEVVSKVERKGDAVRVTSSLRLNGGGPDERTFEASAKGIFFVAHKGKERASPRPDLRLPAKVGDTWTWEQEEPGFAPAKLTWTIAKWEEVEVPAGKFQALRVDSKLESPRTPTLTGTYWYAPGIGVVKSVLNTSTGEQTTVLKSFTPGK